MANYFNKFGKLKTLMSVGIMGKIIGIIFLLIMVLFVVVFFYILPSQENALLAQDETKTKEHVQVAWALADSFYQEASAGAMSMDAAKVAALKEIGSLRYGDDNSGYFWVSDLNAYMVMHPIKTEMDGKDESQYKDPTGKAIFVEFANVVKQSSEGFVNYMWQYGSDANRIEQKISYVKGFTPWGWVIGSGMYIVDIDQALSTTRIQFFILVGILVVVSFFALFYISRSITKNIKRVTKVANKLALGDTKQKVETKTNDEIGLMGKAFTKVIYYLWDMSRYPNGLPKAI